MRKETIEVVVLEPGDVIDISGCGYERGTRGKHRTLAGKTAVVIYSGRHASGRRYADILTDHGESAKLNQAEIDACTYLKSSEGLAKFFSPLITAAEERYGDTKQTQMETE